MHEWEAHLEWEEANWYRVIERETEEEEEEQSLSRVEIEWLNEWVGGRRKMITIEVDQEKLKELYL